MWTLLWQYKAWVLLAAVIVAAALALGIMKMTLDIKSGQLSKKEALLDIVQAQNKVLSQNAAALQDQNRKMNQIKQTADDIHILVSGMTPAAQEGLRNAEITKRNDCIADYFNTGRLPAGCLPVAAPVPKATGTSPG